MIFRNHKVTAAVASTSIKNSFPARAATPRRQLGGLCCSPSNVKKLVITSIRSPLIEGSNPTTYMLIFVISLGVAPPRVRHWPRFANALIACSRNDVGVGVCGVVGGGVPSCPATVRKWIVGFLGGTGTMEICDNVDEAGGLSLLLAVDTIETPIV